MSSPDSTHLPSYVKGVKSEPFPGVPVSVMLSPPHNGRLEASTSSPLDDHAVDKVASPSMDGKDQDVEIDLLAKLEAANK